MDRICQKAFMGRNQPNSHNLLMLFPNALIKHQLIVINLVFSR